jgi:hypothetical protein
MRNPVASTGNYEETSANMIWTMFPTCLGIIVLLAGSICEVIMGDKLYNILAIWCPRS